MGLFTLHNANYPQINDIRRFRAYFLAVCEILTVYFIISLEKLDISAFLFLRFLKSPEISQSQHVSFFVIFDYF